jgi:rhodanese-related sulfurtransferase
MTSTVTAADHRGGPEAGFGTISVDELHHALRGRGELALLDVREPRIVHTAGTPLLAAALPSGQIEARIARLVPRGSTRLAVIDGDGAPGGPAHRAAARLAELGYVAVALVAGGTAAWAAAGHQLYRGTEALGHAFAAFVGSRHRTPQLSAGAVRARLLAGERIVLLDGRPPSGSAPHRLPGAVPAPGAELVHRAEAAVESPDQLVVVHGAGGAGGILGAQALINAGVPNPVVALDGGAMSWALAGFELEHGAPPPVPAPDPSVGAGADRTRHLARRAGVRTVSAAELGALRSDPHRTTYVLDIRPPDEYRAGHVPGSYSAPSWDLVPWVFRHAATLRSRLVLVDGPEGVRAWATALWLVQSGWRDVAILAGGVRAGEVETGDEPDRVVGDDRAVGSVDPVTLARWLAAGEATVIDVAPSPDYRQGHVPGAWFALRSRLPSGLDAPARRAGPLVLTSPDGRAARLAAADLAAAGSGAPVVLDGGTDAWVAAGGAVESGDGRRLHPDDDVIPSPWSAGEDRPDRLRAHLAWEAALIDQLAQDDTTPFRTLAEVTA